MEIKNKAIIASAFTLSDPSLSSKLRHTRLVKPVRIGELEQE